MINEAIQQYYGLQPGELINAGPYKTFFYRNILHTVVDVTSMDEDELTEMHQISQHLMGQGDRQVATFMPNLSGSVLTKIEETKLIICRNALYERKEEASNVGRELSYFHQRGKMLPFQVEKLNRIGQWKDLWEKRLNQMENFWRGKLQELPNHDMERKFIESFPYYLGLTENAMQYLVDTEIDDLPRAIDTATVCHHRFVPDTWGESYYYKLPFDWVFDHPSRDLSEYIRYLYLQNERPEAIRKIHAFLSEYEKVTPLSSFSWRLLYARLLFPVHYFETIEGYYSTGDEDRKYKAFKRLESIVEEAANYQLFLKEFYATMGIPAAKYSIPELEWL
ncbi:spore coat putative kinase YutH [Priestia koreensis]|uniref:spore coat putative kinase YutH n=1 Tax=Priestia koreensis TaxID=284581 RepID=UPI001F5A8055|nr:spore coat protein YutH [Priestia koreensis]MCM3004439.1 spore coat protein YutH [Priestia koreensis]